MVSRKPDIDAHGPAGREGRCGSDKNAEPERKTGLAGAQAAAGGYDFAQARERSAADERDENKYRKQEQLVPVLAGEVPGGEIEGQEACNHPEDDERPVGRKHYAADEKVWKHICPFLTLMSPVIIQNEEALRKRILN